MSALAQILYYLGPFLLPFYLPLGLTLASAAAVGIVWILVRLLSGHGRE